jgi:hypothetical protein
LARRCYRMAMVGIQKSSMANRPMQQPTLCLTSNPRSFLGQVPLVMLATLLAATYLPGSSSPDLVGSSSSIDNGLPSQKARLRRIDFEGSIIFALMVLALLLPIELGGDKLPWTHPAIFVLLGLSGTLIFVFVAVERRQEEPVLPLEIFQSRDAVFSFLILGLQTAAQLGVRAQISVFDSCRQSSDNKLCSSCFRCPCISRSLRGHLAPLRAPTLSRR